MLISPCRFTTGARGGFAPLTQRDIGVNRWPLLSASALRTDASPGLPASRRLP